jgi:hypothetical protein
MARNEAIRLLGDIVKGGDPAADKLFSRSVTTIAELCDLYFADAESGRLLTRRKIAKKASTLVSDRGRIARHIKPILGRMTVAAVTTDDVEAMMHAIASGTTSATAKTKPRGLFIDSVNTRSHPAVVRLSVCPSVDCRSVETRAYPTSTNYLPKLVLPPINRENGSRI